MTAPTATRTHQHCTTTCGCHPATPWMYTTTPATPAGTAANTTTRSDTFFAYVEHACNAYVALLAILVFIVLINR